MARTLIANQNVAPLTFNVLNQTKTLSASLYCYLLMGKVQSKLQMLSLLSPNSYNQQHLQGIGAELVLLASFISGLAGALVQKNLQSGTTFGGGRISYLFTIELCVASIIVLCTSMLKSDGKGIRSEGFFQNWTPQTLITIFTNAAEGRIVVGLVTKYAGAVKKGFALIFGLLLSGILQACMNTQDEDEPKI